MNVTRRNTKEEIIQGALEHIDYIESNSFTKKQTTYLVVSALVVGLFAGLSY